MKNILFLTLIFLAAYCGSQEKKPLYKTGDVINVTGVVSIAGNEPFTKMVVRPADGKGMLILPKEFRKSNKNLTGKTVSVSGKVEAREMKSADHKFTVFEYHLTPDKIEVVK